MAHDDRGDGAIGMDFVDLGLIWRGLSDSVRAFGVHLPRTAQTEREDYLARLRARKAESDELFDRLCNEVKGTP